MRRFLSIYFFLAILIASVSAQPSPPYTGPLYKLQNRQTGYIIEVPANPNQDALEREGTGCTERSDLGTANQQWYVSGDFSANTNTIYIINRNSSQYLTGNSNYSSGSVYQSKQQYDANGNPVQDQKQQWNLTKIIDGGQTYYAIRNVSTPSALVPASSSEYAALSLQNLNNYDPLAQWSLVDITSSTAGGSPTSLSGTYKITNVNSGLALQVVAQSGEPGARIEQGSYIGIASQQWQFIDQRDGNGNVKGFAIINRLSGLALQIVGRSTAAGAAIEQGKFIGINSQLWSIGIQSGTQNTIFQNINSTYVMQVINQSTSPGAQMQQGGYAAIGSQFWRFEYIVPNRLAAPPTAAPAIAETESLTVYPNPSTGELHLAPLAGEKLSEATIFNPQGKVIAKLPVTAGNAINVASLAAGQYVLSVKGEKSSYHTKFVKN